MDAACRTEGRSSIYSPAGCLLCLVALAFAFQGARGLWRPDEARYSLVASEMLRSGDWLTPRLHHEHDHLTKPPLTYWAIAAGLAACGRSEWAVRLPNSIAYAGTVLLVWAIGRRLCPHRARLAAAVYATSGLVFVGASVVTTDTLLTFWETLAAYGFVRGRFGRDPRRRRGARILGAAAGMAFLTKGPPGLLGVLAMALFAVLDEGRRGLRRVADPLGLVLFALLGSGWFLALEVQHPGILGALVQDEVVGRVLTGRHHRNPEWYGIFVVYLPALLLGTLPWTPALVAGLRRGATASMPRDVRRLLRVWLLLPLVVFCLARSRLPLYLLPLFVPLALLTAAVMRFDPLRRATTARWLVVWCAVLLAVRLLSGMVPGGHRDTRPWAEAVAATGFAGGEVLFVDHPPCYGVGVYLGCEVEEIVTEGSGRKPWMQNLAGELAEGEPRQLFVVSQSKVRAFEARARARALRRVPVRVGAHADAFFYELLPAAGAGRRRG